MSLSQLPALNAILNTTSALLLIAGYYFIRRREINRHRACMIGAFAASTLFLTSYLVYHFHHPTTPFTGQGWVRPVYFFILFTHIVLAVVILPLIFMTFARALRDRRSAHVRIARWTLPLWLYVSATGVIVYLMLYRFYG
ncbi:MAG: DUF420 domain-containing protein [Blastocatellales bacterium]|nr:DUF420 domain-containing protein [Blastocatellales bacterium]